MSTPSENVFGSALESMEGPANPEARADARQFVQRALTHTGANEDAELNSEITDNADQAKSALQAARNRLMSLTVNPQQQRMETAAAWLAPTRTGNLGDTLANVAQTKANIMGQNRQLQMLGAENDANLANRLYSMNQQTMAAKERLAALRQNQLGADARTGLNVLARPTKQLGAWKYVQLDAGDGKKQGYWINAASHQKIPDGAPISDSAPVNPTLVKMIGEGEYPALTGFALYNPKLNGLGIMAAVKEAYPWYNAQTYHTIQSTMNNFASGPQGQKLASIDRALQHVDVLEKAHQALQNGDVKGLNFLSNEIGVQLGTGQQTAAAVYDAIKSTVAGELAQAVIQKSGVGERSERAQHLQRDYRNMTTDAIVNAYKSLMKGQLQGLHHQWIGGLMPSAAYANSPKYQAWRNEVDNRFNAKLSPRARRIWTPAPPQAVAYLQAHPNLAPEFKSKYGYLPGED